MSSDLTNGEAARLATQAAEERFERLHRFLEQEVWPSLPEDLRGKPISKAEREGILGIGPEGY